MKLLFENWRKYLKEEKDPQISKLIAAFCARGYEVQDMRSILNYANGFKARFPTWPFWVQPGAPMQVIRIYLCKYHGGYPVERKFGQSEVWTIGKAVIKRAEEKKWIVTRDSSVDPPESGCHCE